MPNEISVLEIWQVFFRIVSGRWQFVSNSQPARSRAIIAPKKFKASSTHAKIFDYIKKFFRFMFAAIRWFFGYYYIGIDIAMDKMAVNLEQVSDFR